jgi:hypothetical protein
MHRTFCIFRISRWENAKVCRLQCVCILCSFLFQDTYEHMSPLGLLDYFAILPPFKIHKLLCK